MNNCIITKLNVAFSDDSLPVFVHRNFKNYLYTTEDGQYINMASLIGSVGISNMIIDIVFKKRSSSGASQIFGVRATQVIIGVNASQLVSVSAGSGDGNNAKSDNSVSPETDIHIILNTSTGAVNIDGVAKTVNIPSTSAVQKAGLFTYYGGTSPVSQTANGIALKSAKFTKVSTGDVVAELYPCIGENGACLYDAVSKTEIYEANGGTLGAE